MTWRRLIPILALMYAPVTWSKPDQDPVVTFYERGYTTCDARVLADLWSREQHEAKFRAGRWMQRGKENRLLRQVKRGRARMELRGAACDFFTETDFDTYEAGMLATAWGMSTEEAKVRIAHAATQGNVEWVWSELTEFESNFYEDRYEYAEDEFPEATVHFEYERSGYTLCDAQLLAAHWRTSVAEAKSTVESKIDNQWEEQIPEALQAAREEHTEHTCEFWQSEFSSEDAEALAEHWGDSSASAKTKVERKLFRGEAESVRSILGRPTPTIQHTRTWRRAGYNTCDASVLAQYWEVGAPEATARGVEMIWNGEPLTTTLAEARVAAADHSWWCPWYENDYTFEDCLKLAEAWHLPLLDAKTKLETKLVRGQNLEVRQLLEGL